MMQSKLCYLCKEPIPKRMRADARFCDSYCRDLTYRIIRGILPYQKAKTLLNKHRKCGLTMDFKQDA